MSDEQERQYTVLVVDDDPKIRRLVAAHMSQHGFKVELAATGEEALDKAPLHQPAAIVLDISMPGIGGFAALERLREWYTNPVLILSATDQEREKVRALDLGADDYVTKPFGTEELAARLRAAIRRAERFSSSEIHANPMVDAGDFKIDLASRLVFKNEDEVRLTRTEFDLLRAMAVDAGKVLTHRHLLQAVWGPEYGSETEYLRTFVKQLRRKLEPDPARPRRILTEPGVGYRLITAQ